MTLIKQQFKLSVILLAIIALATGFTSVAYIQSAHAFSIDFSGLPGFGGNGGLDFLKGPKGDKGDTGAQGPQGEQGPKGDKGDPGAPCPHQSTLHSFADGDPTAVVVNNPTPGEDPRMVCVP